MRSTSATLQNIEGIPISEIDAFLDQFGTFVNLPKASTTFTNLSKPVTSFTNQSRPTTTWTNQPKP